MTLSISFCKWRFYWLSVFDKIFFNEFLSEKCINVVDDVSVAVFDIKGTENGGDYEIRIFVIFHPILMCLIIYMGY